MHHACGAREHDSDTVQRGGRRNRENSSSTSKLCMANEVGNSSKILRGAAMLRVHRSACLWFVAAVLCIPIAPASAQPPVVMEPLGDLVGGAHSRSYARGGS